EEQHEIFVSWEHEKAAKRMLHVFLREAKTRKLDFSDLGLSEDGSLLMTDAEDGEELSGDDTAEITLEAGDTENLGTDGCEPEEASFDQAEDIELLEEAAEANLAAMQQAEEIPLVYQNKRDRAEEYKSSAWALLIVGVLGLALIVIYELGLLPVQFHFNKVMIYGVMGTVFVLFLVIAVYSFAQSKKLFAQAETEDGLKERILNYLASNFPKEQPADEETKAPQEGQDEGKQAKKNGEHKESHTQQPDEEDVGQTEQGAEHGGEEQLYFVRTARMKRALMDEFAEADAAFIEQLVDDYYEQLYS
ncbi:MAG: hypothetical protein IJ711_08625, partial [Lachnospiraceae bacterium]|nr:hypothetical protein [Lachnospiraceae bacterium]